MSNMQLKMEQVDVKITNLQTFSQHHILRTQFANCQLIIGLVEDIGVEPMTLCVQGRCSSQLS